MVTMNVRIELSCLASRHPSFCFFFCINFAFDSLNRRKDGRKRIHVVSVRCACNLNQHRRVEPSMYHDSTWSLRVAIFEYVSPLRFNMPSAPTTTLQSHSFRCLNSSSLLWPHRPRLASAVLDLHRSIPINGSIVKPPSVFWFVACWYDTQ